MKVGKRFAILLVLLVVGQEFCLARHAYQRVQLQQLLREIRNQKRASKHEEKRLTTKHEEKSLASKLEEKSLATEHEEKSLATKLKERGLEVKGRQKRASIATIALVSALAVSATAIGFEVYFAIDKCCGVEPQVCTDSDEFNNIEKEMEPLSKEIDEDALICENLKEDIVQTNTEINQLWNEMLRIGEYEEELVTTLSPDVIKDFNNKWYEIEEELKAKNSTVMAMSDADVRDQYESYFQSFETAMIGMSNFIGLSLIGVGTVAYNYYKNNQINKMIDDLGSGQGYKQLTSAKAQKAQKILGVSPTNVNNFIQETAVAKVNTKFTGSSSRFTTVMNGINIVGSLISVAFDVYSIVAKFQYCDELKDQVAKALVEMKKAKDGMDEARQNVTDLDAYLNTEGWDVISAQLIDSNFQESLHELQLLAEGSHTEDPEMTATATTIENFISTINGSVSDTTATYNLVKGLNAALIDIRVLLSCYVNRAKLLTHISDECKKGSDSLQNLYDESVPKFGTDGDNCILDDDGNAAYTTFEGTEKSIESMAATEGYNVDCVLNSADKKETACRYQSDGYTNDQIASMMSLTTAQVEHFLTDCPEPELTPVQEGQICSFKSLNFSAAQIHSLVMPDISEATIQAYMDNNC